MADFYTIEKKKTEFTVKIDDMDIVFTPLGAGSDLTFSQKQRRSEFLRKKINTLQESAKTQEDFDSIEKTMEEFEALDLEVQQTVREMFTPADGFEAKVKTWIDSTSIYMLLTYIEEIGKQIAGDKAPKAENGESEAS